MNDGDFVISQPGFPESVEIRQAGMEREGYGGVTGWDRAGPLGPAIEGGNLFLASVSPLDVC